MNNSQGCQLGDTLADERGGRKHCRRVGGSNSGAGANEGFTCQVVLHSLICQGINQRKRENMIWLSKMEENGQGGEFKSGGRSVGGLARVCAEGN